jgi:hypothetical protein
MDGTACIVAEGIRSAGYTIAITGVGHSGPTVVATREDGRTLEVTAASDLEAMVELSKRVLLDDLGRHWHN